MSPSLLHSQGSVSQAETGRGLDFKTLWRHKLQPSEKLKLKIKAALECPVKATITQNIQLDFQINVSENQFYQ